MPRQLPSELVDNKRTISDPTTGEETTFIETAEESGGQRVVMRLELAAGTVVPPHAHPFEEAFECTEGQLQFRVNGRCMELLPGGAVTVPATVVHGLSNLSQAPAAVRIIDTARTLVIAEPAAATALLGELKGQVKATIGDIRRLVYALRPPALDEFGLVSAIREHAAHYDESQGPRVEIDAPDVLPPLSAAVEVAAYRIVLEALTNVARHAQAHRCCIRLELADGLCLEITDDGVGLPPEVRAWVGLASMREHAAELGGDYRIEPVLPGGTRVCARLPLAIVQPVGTS